MIRQRTGWQPADRPAGCRRSAALFVALTFLAACSEPAPEKPIDMREPIAVQYVGPPELPVHKWATDDSAIITKFLNGESVSIMSRKGEWSEVRTGSGSGWVRTSDLADAKTAQAERDDPQPRFKHMPSPVTLPGAHGTIYIEANVNTEGEITSAKVINNTTGSDELATRNAAALERARFYPMVIKGHRKPFVYYYRVDY